MYDTILVDGTDIKSGVARQITVWDDLFETAPLRGDFPVVPFADGEANVDQSFDAYTLGIGLTLLASDRQGFNDARRTLTRLVKPGKTVTLSRLVAYGTGNETHTTVAKYQSGLGPVGMTGQDTGRLVVNMRILDGLWFGSAVTIAAGTHTILGDVRTRRMLVTVSAGTAPVVTNTTNGSSFTVSGSTGTPVVVDVENMSASDSGGDCSERLSWSGTWPLQLEAGSNTLTISSGTLSVAYQPAYQ